MINEYLSLKHAIGRVIRAFFLLSLAMMYVGHAFILLDVSFTNHIRTFLVAILAIPCYLLFMAVYIYEHRISEPILRKRFYIGLSLTAIYLLTPSLFLVYRYVLPHFIFDLLKTSSIVLLLAPFVSFASYAFSKPASDNTVIYFIGFIFSVMWEPWSSSGDRSQQKLAMNVDIEQVRKRRSIYYGDKEALEVFQRTLSCQEVDASVISNTIMSNTNMPGKITALDIGGGEGRFACNFFNSICDDTHQLTKLHMIDPVNWANEYRQNCSTLGLADHISIEQTDFISFDPNVQYDLVLASHSLYATWDNFQNDRSSAKEEALRLLSFLKKDGLAAVVMASNRGLSYQFKSRALQCLFGTSIEDTTIELFQRSVRDKVIREIYIDNLIDLTELIEDLTKGGCLLHQWLSYFLRYDIVRLPRTEKNTLVSMLLEYVNPLDSMSETDLEYWMEKDSLNLSRNSMVLMHKTKALLITN